MCVHIARIFNGYRQCRRPQTQDSRNGAEGRVERGQAGGAAGVGGVGGDGRGLVSDLGVGGGRQGWTGGIEMKKR